MEMFKAKSVKLTESFLTPNFEDICWKQSDENYSSKSPENYLKTCSFFLGNFNVYFLSWLKTIIQNTEYTNSMILSKL